VQDVSRNNPVWSSVLLKQGEEGRLRLVSVAVGQDCGPPGDYGALRVVNLEWLGGSWQRQLQEHRSAEPGDGRRSVRPIGGQCSAEPGDDDGYRSTGVQNPAVAAGAQNPVARTSTLTARSRGVGLQELEKRALRP
jgi:hypothetical protein